ncbi:hypothetical protein POM88_009042 [Heracleum sosnowskyi]|uniref:HMA domain-containing protein n=1 Tax=Heracleum sosnowskyi TaxID=360622 RepID=A0AAD8J965_9APIA|nr:hypothetical protein POM88_009042 [Heracleum sosnowskyi]
MKQRIDVKLTIKNEKHRSKAMQIVAGIMGVSSVTMGGDDKNILIVIGNEVDAVTLTRSLIKKIGNATLVRVVPLDDGRFDPEQAEASMSYEGQSNNYGDYTYGQPKYGYYNLPVPQYYPPPYYYQYQRPNEW